MSDETTPSTDVDGDGRTTWDLHPLLSDEERDGFARRLGQATKRATKQKIREERRFLKDKRREERAAARKIQRIERREAGDAWWQILGETVRQLPDVYDEDAARRLIMREIEDAAQDVRDGEDAGHVIEQVLDAVARDGDEILDFSGVPVIGGVLEIVDDYLVRALIESLRPWAIQALTRRARRG